MKNSFRTSHEFPNSVRPSSTLSSLSLVWSCHNLIFDYFILIIIIIILFTENDEKIMIMMKKQVK
jgi:hypothetical protein